MLNWHKEATCQKRERREENTWQGDQTKRVGNTPQTSPEAQDTYDWEEWGTPPDRTLSRDDFFTPDFLLPIYPELGLRQVADGNWPRSICKVEVYVRNRPTVVPVVFGVEMFEVMNGIMKPLPRPYGRGFSYSNAK